MNAHPRSIASRRPFRCHVAPLGLLTGLVLVILGPTMARAATIDVTGPAGAEVSIDGAARGVLPLPRPLPVEPGRRILEVRKRGHVTHQEVVEVTSPDHAIQIDVDLISLNRWQAMGSSAVLAGLGQLYQSRPTMGWTMLALQVGAWGWLFYSEDQYKSARDDYLTELTAYEAETDRFDIVARRDATLAAFDDVESKNDLRTYATITVIAIGAWSVFDAWRQHDRYYEASESSLPIETAVSRDVDGTRVEVAWKWNF